MKRPLALALVLAVAGGAAAARQATPVDRTLNSQDYKNAVAVLERGHEQIVADIIRLTEIPAAPFKEAARGKAYFDLLKQTSLTNLEIDPEGNVMGVRKGAPSTALGAGPSTTLGAGPSTALGAGGLVAIAAHLDTVFPEGTDVHVKRTGTRLAAPGIGDNTRGLAVLLGILRAMDAAKVRTRSDILFVANVGEEGPGDLRGMRYLFQKGRYRNQIKSFISIDGEGAGNEITNGGVGSKRYKVAFKGPGGHSYGAFGLVSPAFAMGDAMTRIAQIKVPSSPKTTFNVGVVGGGTSVNSIPFETWLELDLRSESKTELDKLDQSAKALIAAAVNNENSVRSIAQGRVTADIKLIGDRPSGQTASNLALPQTAAAVVRALGMSPTFNYSSTDANLPMSLGIPAVTLDSGGSGGRAHALDEWIDVEPSKSLVGIRSILAILLATAGQSG